MQREEGVLGVSSEQSIILGPLRMKRTTREDKLVEEVGFIKLKEGARERESQYRLVKAAVILR